MEMSKEPGRHWPDLTAAPVHRSVRSVLVTLALGPGLALAAHASQVTDIGMFLAMPEDVFARLFGTEWYIEPGAEPGLRDGWLLEGV